MRQYRPLAQWSSPPGKGRGCVRRRRRSCIRCAVGRWCCTSSTRSPSCRSNGSSSSSATRRERVTKTLQDQLVTEVPVEFVEQRVQRGTGDAVSVALTVFDDLDAEDDILVLPSDAPLVRAETIARLATEHRVQDAAAADPHRDRRRPDGLGRVVRGKDGRVARVVEHADATRGEREIDEINTSIYCFRRGLLAPALRRLSPENAQGEYYLTDAIAVLRRRRAQRGGARGRRSGRGDHGQRPGRARRRRSRVASRASTGSGCAPGSRWSIPRAPTSTRRVELEADVRLLPGHDPRGPHGGRRRVGHRA